MKTSVLAGLMLAFLSLAGVSAHAAGAGSPDEAKAMAVKAAEFLRANGPEKAFSAFNSKAAPWVDRDLYVFVFDEAGTAVARADGSPLLGKKLIDLKDPEGRPFVREMIAIQEANWTTDYKWRDPLTGAVLAKASYIVPVDTYRVGVGIYRQ